MSHRAVGWAWVAGQAVLIGALALVPAAEHYSLPSWLRTLTTLTFWAGVVLAAVAGAFLGRALTATPVPTRGATLKTSGPYRFARHPIYTGVVLIVIAMAARSGSVFGLILGTLTIGFFHLKAAWEEHRLNERFVDYASYARRTPRFLPRIIPRSR